LATGEYFYTKFYVWFLVVKPACVNAVLIFPIAFFFSNYLEGCNQIIGRIYYLCLFREWSNLRTENSTKKCRNYCIL